jgi:uncharacterized protein
MDSESLPIREMKKKLAVVGSGISGLGCIYDLRDTYDITLFEKNNYIGGHSNTIEVDGSSFDTGFMVFNHHTYPLLTKLFSELGVDTYPTSMSFSVQHKPSNLEFSGSGWTGLFGQKRNIARASFWKLLSHINRFNTEGRNYLNSSQEEITVREFCKELKLSNDFLYKYLIPMSSAVWSTPEDLMLDFPAVTLLQFFENHGFLGMNTQHQWYTVKGGSRSYVEKLINTSKPELRLNSPVSKVYRHNGKVMIETTGRKEEFDKVIIAAHGDQARKIVDDLNSDERKILSSFDYQKNIATIHDDELIMPDRKKIWSSWNYRVNKSSDTSTIYWMNNLQRIENKRNFFVSIDDKGCISRKKIIREIEYEHPLFSLSAIKHQPKLKELNRDGLYFCGAYHGYGFHEDGLHSAKALTKQLINDNI